MNIGAKAKSLFKEDFKFLKGWITNPVTVGSIKPTGKIAAKSMASILPIDSGGPVLELGPGTGVITKQILARGLPAEKLFSIEYSADFYEYLNARFKGVNFIHGDAFNLDETLADYCGEKFCAIVSAIPLLNVPKTEREKLISNALERISGDGPFIQICYGPLPPIGRVPGKFIVEKHDRIMRNVPPVAIWVYRKDIH